MNYNDFLYERLDQQTIEDVVKKYAKDYEYNIKKNEDGIVIDMRIDSYSSDYEEIPDKIKTELLDNFDNDISEIYAEWETYFTVFLKKESIVLEKKRKDKDVEHGLPKPDSLKVKMKGVSLGKDKQGYFVYTHRARCSSYETPEDIPTDKIKFIDSTG